MFAFRFNRRKVKLSLITFFCMLSFFGQVAFGYSLEIREMIVDIVVDEENAYEIKERIIVDFNDANMHGIFREIPTKTYYGKGVRVSGVKVTSHPYDSSWSGDYINIKIGDPDQYARATEIYDLQYRYAIGDDRNTELDEFYFNIIGPEWQIPIHKTVFSVEMPESFDASKVNFTSGYFGNTDTTEVQYEIIGNKIVGSLDQTLNPGEALTIALPLPEGYYTEVIPDGQQIDNFAKTFYISFPLLIALAVWIMFKWGKDKQMFPTVEFYPPEGLTPLEIGYIYDGQVDVYDITSMLIYWADRGYLRIIEEEEETGLIFKKMKTRITLEKIMDLPLEAKSFERIYFNDLFDTYGYDGRVEIDSLKEKFYQTVSKVKSELHKSFKGRSIFSHTGTLAMLLIGLIGIVLLCFSFLPAFNALGPYSTGFTFLFGAIASVLLSSMVILSSNMFKLSKTRLPSEKAKMIVSSVVSGGIGLVIIGGVLLVTDVGVMSWIGALLAILCFYMAPHAEKRSDLGIGWLAHLIGLKSFIENAEKPRIKMLVDENPNYFFNILPYAMVLGVTDQWAKQFEDITLENPQWYSSGQSGRMFSAAYFATHMNESTRDIGRTMASAPASSSGGGSFGGGSSGGGSGGGGGGGW